MKRCRSGPPAHATAKQYVAVGVALVQLTGAHQTGTLKQCRERWLYTLDPSIKQGAWSEEEDRILLQAQTELGNRWVEISKVPAACARAECHTVLALHRML